MSDIKKCSPILNSIEQPRPPSNPSSTSQCTSFLYKKHRAEIRQKLGSHLRTLGGWEFLSCLWKQENSYHASGNKRSYIMPLETREVPIMPLETREVPIMPLETREVISCLWKQEKLYHASGNKRSYIMPLETREVISCLWKQEKLYHASGNKRSYIMPLETREVISCLWKQEKLYHASGNKRSYIMPLETREVISCLWKQEKLTILADETLNTWSCKKEDLPGWPFKYKIDIPVVFQ